MFLQPAINVFVSFSMIPLQLLRESYLVLPSSTTIVERALHPSKVLVSIDETLWGIVMEVRLLQLQKTEPSMLVTPLGMFILVRFIQPLKALFPIIVTPLEMVTEVRALQL